MVALPVTSSSSLISDPEGIQALFGSSSSMLVYLKHVLCRGRVRSHNKANYSLFVIRFLQEICNAIFFSKLLESWRDGTSCNEAQLIGVGFCPLRCRVSSMSARLCLINGCGWCSRGLAIQEADNVGGKLTMLTTQKGTGQQLLHNGLVLVKH